MKLEYKNLNIIGADETGVGDYMTPLVAAACFVPKQNVHKLEVLGITDSKKLSDKKIVELAAKIKTLTLFSVKHLTPSGYNKLNSSFNANELKMFLHLGAINLLEERVSDADLIILDQFSTKNSIDKYTNRLLGSTFGFKQMKAPIKYVEKGEMEHVAVAAASILARDKLVSLMEAQGQKWGVEFPLGTNKIVEEFAREFVRNNGEEALGQVAKLSFKTTEKIIKK